MKEKLKEELNNKIKNKKLRIFISYFIIFILIIPLFYLLIWSFTEKWPWPYLFPQEFSLESWLYFFDPRSGAIKALFISFVIALGVTIIALLISIPAGKALGLYDFYGKEFIKFLVLAPIIVPPLAVSMGIHINFIRFGLAGRITGVILVHLIPTIPYSIKILTDVFSALGEKIEEQARVLGANRWKCFIYVTLPLIKSGIISAGTMVFIISFSQYFLTFLIGGGRVITFPMVLFPLIETGNRSLASVYSWVFIIAALIFTIIIEKVFKNKKFRKDYLHL